MAMTRAAITTLAGTCPFNTCILHLWVNQMKYSKSLTNVECMVLKIYWSESEWMFFFSTWIEPTHNSTITCTRSYTSSSNNVNHKYTLYGNIYMYVCETAGKHDFRCHGTFLPVRVQAYHWKIIQSWYTHIQRFSLSTRMPGICRSLTMSIFWYLLPLLCMAVVFAYYQSSLPRWIPARLIKS